MPTFRAALEPHAWWFTRKQIGQELRERYQHKELPPKLLSLVSKLDAIEGKRSLRRLPAQPQGRTPMANPRQIERDVNEISRKAADQAEQAGRAISETAERAGRAASAAVQRNTETFSKTWQSSSETASRIAERSMEQFSNLLGLGGDNARQGVQESAASVQALLDTSTVVTSGMQNVSGEWIRFVQNRVEENLKRFDEMMGCRNLQDCFAIQARLARDNCEAFLQTARRTSELSTKLADDAVKQMSDRH